MRYKLQGEIDWNLDPVCQILKNRGIELSKIHEYLNLTDRVINSPRAFGEENMREAAVALIKTIQNKEHALVIVDCDCDGYTSAALIINYLYEVFPQWAENRLHYFLHSGKTHGLSDCCDMILNNDYDLIIIPDASSNDYEYHKKLKEDSRTIIILDHHEAERIPEDTICINNQLSSYPNKALSGVGVTWQFCRYLDELLYGDYANNYLDLVALGLTGDVMNMKSFETKYLISKGFREENIKNPFIYNLAMKNSFSLGSHITPIGAAFYLVPFINAIVRSGTIEEKDLIFRAMLKHTAFEEVESTKRGAAAGEKERVVDQAIRTAINVKNRQTREQDKAMELLEEKIAAENLLENKVIILICNKKDVDPNIAGLIANKIMAKYQRPTLLLFEKDDSYAGSARGYEKSGIKNFKDICSETGEIDYAEGHQNAFGISIPAANLQSFIEKTNEALKDMESEALYYVDYIFSGVDVKGDIICAIANMEDLWGQGVEESLICVENLKVTKENLTLMSPDKKPTLKITLPNKVCFIKFNSSQEEYEQLITDGYLSLNIVGSCNANEWNGNITPQVLIKEYEIIDKCDYNF